MKDVILIEKKMKCLIILFKLVRKEGFGVFVFMFCLQPFIIIINVIKIAYIIGCNIMRSKIL